MTRLQECLAENIKLYRKRKNLTQEKLAEQVGTSTNYIGLIETGKKFPSLAMLERLADALTVHSIDLFWDKNAAERGTESLELRLMKNIQRAVQETFAE